MSPAERVLDVCGWQSFSYSFGVVEYEYNEDGYTGWYRYAGERSVEYNYITGKTRVRPRTR